jgi:hypothetical protein
MFAIELRLPSIKGSDKEQLAQIKSFLYQHICDLQWILNNINQQDSTVTQAKNVTTPQRIMTKPKNKLTGLWNPNSLEDGSYVVTDNYPLKSESTVVMNNGILVQMRASDTDNVKLQLAFPQDSENPKFRICWFSNWSDWRSLKI